MASTEVQERFIAIKKKKSTQTQTRGNRGRMSFLGSLIPSLRTEDEVVQVKEEDRVVFWKDTVRIGREAGESGNDVVISNNEASRFHATFERTPLGVWVFTDHSSNGTLHESNQIITRIHQSSVVLKNGDTLTIGNILLEIELEPLNLSRRPAEKHIANGRDISKPKKQAKRGKAVDPRHWARGIKLANVSNSSAPVFCDDHNSEGVPFVPGRIPQHSSDHEYTCEECGNVYRANWDQSVLCGPCSKKDGRCQYCGNMVDPLAETIQD